MILQAVEVKTPTEALVLTKKDHMPHQTNQDFLPPTLPHPRWTTGQLLLATWGLPAQNSPHHRGEHMKDFGGPDSLGICIGQHVKWGRLGRDN